jgi:hypothetical protein
MMRGRPLGQRAERGAVHGGWRKGRWLLAACLTILPHVVGAQSNTDEMLHRAIRLYEDLQIERALVMFREVISPSTPFVVSTEQRVIAYKYLGAAHATLGQPDSASVYFRAAIERDPFVDLNGHDFTPREREVFLDAKQRTFAVAIRPIGRSRIDPRFEQMTFQVLTTHGALLRAEIRTAAGDVSPIFESENDGVRDVPWNGVLASGRLAPPGTYELVVRGDSHLLPSRSDSARVFFTIEHDRPPLEDTLPALGPTDLLPEHYPPSAPTVELAKGLGIGVAAIAMPTLLGHGEFAGPNRALAATVSAAGITVGILGFRWRREHNDLTQNIAENVRRRTTRLIRNAEIKRDNEAKLAMTALVITPAAGVGP